MATLRCLVADMVLVVTAADSCALWTDSKEDREDDEDEDEDDEEEKKKKEKKKDRTRYFSC